MFATLSWYMFKLWCSVVSEVVIAVVAPLSLRRRDRSSANSKATFDTSSGGKD